jgi:hypothetical protein
MTTSLLIYSAIVYIIPLHVHLCEIRYDYFIQYPTSLTSLPTSFVACPEDPSSARIPRMMFVHCPHGDNFVEYLYGYGTDSCAYEPRSSPGDGRTDVIKAVDTTFPSSNRSEGRMLPGTPIRCPGRAKTFSYLSAETEVLLSRGHIDP